MLLCIAFPRTYFFILSLSLSDPPFLYIFLSTYLSISTNLPGCLFIYLPICQFTYLLTYPFHIFISVSIHAHEINEIFPNGASLDWSNRTSITYANERRRGGRQIWWNELKRNIVLYFLKANSVPLNANASSTRRFLRVYFAFCILDVCWFLWLCNALLSVFALMSVCLSYAHILDHACSCSCV